MAKHRIRNQRVARDDWGDLRWTQSMNKYLNEEERKLMRKYFVLSDLTGHKFSSIIDATNASKPEFGAVLENILEATAMRYLDHVDEIKAKRKDAAQKAKATRRANRIILPEVEWDDEDLEEDEEALEFPEEEEDEVDWA